MADPGPKDNDAGPAPTEAPAGAPPEPLPPSRRRDPRFRAQLIERLPPLGYSSWSAREDFKVDQEWGGIVSPQSDAVLGPLEAIVPGGQGPPDPIRSQQR